MPDMRAHTRQLDTGWRTVAAHTARLGLSVGGLAGLLTLFHTALTINPPIPVPIHPPTYLDGHLAMVAATSVLCGLTWLAHRAARPHATRIGAVGLLVAAIAQVTHTVCLSCGPGLPTRPERPDLPAAVCTLILLGGAAVCAMFGAGRPTSRAAGEFAAGWHRRRVRIGLGLAASAVFILSFWSGLDATLDQRWVWLTWSISLWGSAINSAINADSGPSRHHPARLRAAALLGALLAPTALAHVQLAHIRAGETSSHQLVGRQVAAVATLALTLALVTSCWRLSRHHDTHRIAGSTPTRADLGARAIPAPPSHRHEPTPTQTRKSTAGGDRAPDPASDPDPSTGSAAYGRHGND